jgi:mono/diheme cytochrome c family protein
MTFAPTRKALAGVALVVLTGSALAQTQGTARVDFGKREYDSNCAVCHGKAGKGDGPYVEFLKRSPPDLTQMSRGNGGVFPMQRAYEVIEGAGTGHGTRDMPVWGRDYSVQAAEYYIDAPYSSEAYVRTRIFALVEYLNRLQSR